MPINLELLRCQVSTLPLKSLQPTIYSRCSSQCAAKTRRLYILTNVMPGVQVWNCIMIKIYSQSSWKLIRGERERYRSVTLLRCATTCRRMKIQNFQEKFFQKLTSFRYNNAPEFYQYRTAQRQKKEK